LSTAGYSNVLSNVMTVLISWIIKDPILFICVLDRWSCS